MSTRPPRNLTGSKKLVEAKEALHDECNDWRHQRLQHQISLQATRDAVVNLPPVESEDFETVQQNIISVANQLLERVQVLIVYVGRLSNNWEENNWYGSLEDINAITHEMDNDPSGDNCIQIEDIDIPSGLNSRDKTAWQQLKAAAKDLLKVKARAEDGARQVVQKARAVRHTARDGSRD